MPTRTRHRYLHAKLIQENLQEDQVNGGVLILQAYWIGVSVAFRRIPSEGVVREWRVLEQRMNVV